ncbi:virion transmembrane glycoprotein [Hapavirus ngaingan]|uniref:Virion transmembrane glycoprotein n=1 Tax=Hapavirus ngaingan TaxID=1972623 RepID=D3GGL7_9RHAB|nr:virion transmembrane glycoprotein [Hapavirus ngaingan]ACX83608.1 virion transmembrane glycoprotein [Hapavirus ngaingan]
MKSTILMTCLLLLHCTIHGDIIPNFYNSYKIGQKQRRKLIYSKKEISSPPPPTTPPSNFILDDSEERKDGGMFTTDSVIPVGPVGGVSFHNTKSQDTKVALVTAGTYNISDFNSHHLMNFPVKCVGDWKEVDLSSIRCPRFSNLDMMNEGRREIGLAIHPVVSDGVIAQGLLCQKQKWISECSETWYWTTEETSYVENEPVSGDECLLAYSQFKVGKHIEPAFPPFACYWNSVNKVHQSYITLHDHDVKLDPYTDKFIDPILYGGQCEGSLCPTIHDNVYWIEKDDGEDLTICNLHHWEHSKIYALTGESSEVLKDDESYDYRYKELIYLSFLESGSYGMRSTKNACKTDICGVKGIRFSTGEWWGIVDREKTYLEVAFPDCTPNIDITLHHLHSGSSHIYEHNVFKDYHCKDVISRLMSGAKVSPTDISLLVPDQPGIGHAYKIDIVGARNTQNQNSPVPYSLQFKQRVCLYQLIDTTGQSFNVEGNPEGGRVKVGVSHSGGDVYINISQFEATMTGQREVADSGDEQVLIWTAEGTKTYSINGMYLRTKNNTPTQLIFPSSAMLEGLYDESLLYPVSLDILQRPRVLIVGPQDDYVKKILENDNTLNRTDIIEGTKKAINSFVDKITGVFKGFTQIIWWGITGVCTIILWKLYRKYKAWKRNKTTKRTTPNNAKKSTTIYKNPTFREDVESQSEHLYDSVDMRRPQTYFST